MEEEKVEDDKAADADFRKVPKTRRRFVFQPKHIEPSMFRFGEEVTFFHLDHRMIQDKICSALDDEDIFSFSQTCWFVHDDCQAVLRRRAASKYGELDDPLLLQVMKKYEKNLPKDQAKKLFCLDDHDLEDVDHLSEFNWRYRRKKVFIRPKDAAEASIARHGSLACMQNYAARVVKNRSAKEVRRAQHEERRAELVEELNKKNIDYDEFVYCDLKENCEKWIDYGTKYTTKKLVTLISDAMERQKELRGKLGEETWQQVCEQKTVASYVDGYRSIEDTKKMLDNMLRKRKKKAEEQDILKKRRTDFEEEAKKIMGEDADLKKLSAKVEKGGIDVKDALDELRNRKKDMTERENRACDWLKDRDLDIPVVDQRPAVWELFVQSGKATMWRSLKEDLLSKIFLSTFPFSKTLGKTLAALSPEDFKDKKNKLMSRIETLKKSPKLYKYLQTYDSVVNHEKIAAKFYRFLYDGNHEDWALVATDRFEKFFSDERYRREYWFRSAFVSFIISENPDEELVVKEPEKPKPFARNYWF